MFGVLAPWDLNISKFIPNKFWSWNQLPGRWWWASQEFIRLGNWQWPWFPWSFNTKDECRRCCFTRVGLGGKFVASFYQNHHPVGPWFSTWLCVIYMLLIHLILSSGLVWIKNSNAWLSRQLRIRLVIWHLLCSILQSPIFT